MKNKSDEAKIRVMIVDDHESMRDALRTVINLEPDLVLAAEAESGAEAIECLHTKPDVVLMDNSMPGMNGMETTRRLRELQPDLKVISITLYEETSYLEEMIKAGVSGYVLKSGSPTEIVKAVRTVAKGGTHFDSSIPRHRQHPTGQDGTRVEELNDQELAVAIL